MNSPRYVTPKDGLGMAIVALGVLSLILPWGSSAVATAVKGNAYAILIGTTYVFGLMTLLAGVAVLMLKTKDE